jgi:hypothetical protein
MTGPKITIARKSGVKALAQRVVGITKYSALVGIPAAGTAERSAQLLRMAGKSSKKLKKAAKNDVTNAELLFLLSKGSPLRHQPARPVLEPAVEADGNKQPIARELAASVKSSLDGDKDAALKGMMRAALAGQNAARKWFTDPRNGWAPNAPSTIARKGSDRPGIDSGAMRAAIVGLVREK